VASEDWDEIDALYAKGTPGKWQAHHWQITAGVSPDSDGMVTVFRHTDALRGNCGNDTELVARLHNEWPTLRADYAALAAELERLDTERVRLEHERDRLRAALDRIRDKAYVGGGMEWMSVYGIARAALGPAGETKETSGGCVGALPDTRGGSSNSDEPPHFDAPPPGEAKEAREPDRGRLARIADEVRREIAAWPAEWREHMQSELAKRSYGCGRRDDAPPPGEAKEAREP